MEENKVIYSMDRVGKTYPGNRQVLRDISLGYYYGAKIGVLGLNGSGKSSLLRIMAGLDNDYTGRTAISKGYTIGYLEQDPQLDKDKTVQQVVAEGLGETYELLNKYNQVNEKLCEPMDDDEMNKLLEWQGKLQDQLDAANAWDVESRLDLAMEALRCPPPEMLCGQISGGEKRRVALCRLLLQEPDILLLDEPTNHLDAETVLWLEHHLQNYAGTVIAITHDRYFLDNVAGWILELDRGFGIPWRGNYSSWLEQKQARLAQEEKTAGRRQKTLERELAWIKTSTQTKHTLNKARIARYEAMLAEDFQKENETNEIYIPAGPKLGQSVVTCNHLGMAFGDRLLFDDLDVLIPAGAIVGIIGPNGAGKTTLFNVLTHLEQPVAGSVNIGETVKMAYVNQDRRLDPDRTLTDIIGNGAEVIKVGAREMNVRQYLARFNFSSAEHGKTAGELSGGEKSRAHLAFVLQQGGNVLLLDEPTNDLDVHTIRALEEALLNFAGTVLVISHDRWFLDRLCTHILAFEGDSKVRWFEGNFGAYEEDKVRRLGEKALIPKRITYRPLTRV